MNPGEPDGSLKLCQVTKNSIIGYSGGDASTWSYDQCTTGAHLHLTVAKGLYGDDYGFNALTALFENNKLNGFIDHRLNGYDDT